MGLSKDEAGVLVSDGDVVSGSWEKADDANQSEDDEAEGDMLDVGQSRSDKDVVLMEW